MQNKPSKQCDTSIRVLQTLLLLTQKTVSIQDILNHFKNTEHEIYTNEVILKYLNTLKVFGFRFIKEKSKYTLINEIPQISFNSTELEGLNLLIYLSFNFPEKTIYNVLQSLKEKLERKFDNNSRILLSNIKPLGDTVIINDYNKYESLVLKIEQYCEDKQKLKIVYTLNDKDITINAIPLELKYDKNKIYFCCYNSNCAQILDIRISNIKLIEQLPSKINSENFLLSSVLFKLKDRLAKSYNLKDGEKLFQSLPNGDIIISNYKEDRTLLLHRLLRYGELCEIISPVSLREEMHKLITEMLKNNSN